MPLDNRITVAYGPELMSEHMSIPKRKAFSKIASRGLVGEVSDEALFFEELKFLNSYFNSHSAGENPGGDSGLIKAVEKLALRLVLLGKPSAKF